MYSRYEEMRVMKQVMKNYADNQKRNYEETITELKKASNSADLHIDSKTVGHEISSVQGLASSLSDYYAEYQIGLSVVSELNKATMCYEQGYTPENIQSGLADERMKEGNVIFNKIKTENPEYKRIMSEISYSLFVAHDPHVEGLGTDIEASLASLEKNFTDGRISKEELIYYSNVYKSLLRNPDYIKYMSQFQKEQPEQGVQR